MLKALPALLIVLLALRRSHVRVAALDVFLIGAWTGAGFAVYENALFGRGGPNWSVNAPFSLLFPTESAGGTTIAGGHLVWTGLLALALGFGLLYRQRFRLAWVAVPVAFVVAFAEHVSTNAHALGAPTLLDLAGSPPLLARILGPLTLGGRLSSLLIIAGLAGVAVIEWRAIHGIRPKESVLLTSVEANRRSRWLAGAQRPAVGATPDRTGPDRTMPSQPIPGVPIPGAPIPGQTMPAATIRPAADGESR